MSMFLSEAPDSRVDELSLVHIYFQDLKIVKYYTDELFSWQDILGTLNSRQLTKILYCTVKGCPGIQAL
jgi:hypothetical protein